jgi:MFS family permease/cbb3-type cytochrome oxidase subunit 3
MNIYLIYFIILVIACVAITYLFKPKEEATDKKKEDDKKKVEESNPEYQKLNKSYLIVYSLVVTGDWLQGPYNYSLYQSYGLSIEQIGWMSVCGFLSSLLLGTYVGSTADKFGRKKMCLVFCALYGTSCLLRYVPNVFILLFGRVLSGISTSLLFSCFEAWLINEHNSKGFAASLLSNTLTWAAFLNGLTAIISGLIGNVVVSYFSYAAPYGVAVIFFAISALYIQLNWGENYGNTESKDEKDKKDEEKKSSSALMEGISVILKDFTILSVGLIQSFFEAAMYIFVFLYCPILEEAHKLGGHKDELPFGLIFAGFMICIMIGSRIFNILMQNQWKVITISLPIFLLGTVSMLLPIVTMNEHILYWAFALFETCCGIFFPTLGCIKSQIIPEEVRSSVMNLFRVPMNAIVVIVLLLISHLTQEAQFIICAVLCALSFALSFNIYRKETGATTTAEKKDN